MRPLGYQPLLISTGVRGSALRSPAKIALTDARREITYRDLVRDFNRVADLATTALGLAKGDHVAMMLPNSIEFLTLVCGLSDAGVAPAIIHPQASLGEMLHICDDSQARVLFLHDSLRHHLAEARFASIERMVIVGGEGDFAALMAAAATDDPTVVVEETDIFCIPYTSGTTGKPKGVLLPHRARTFHLLLSIATNQGKAQPHMRGLGVAPFANGAGLVNGLAPIWFGGTCHIVEKFEPEATLRAIQQHRITSIFLVPTHFHAIFNLPRAVLDSYDVSSLEVISAGAAALPQATKERIVAYFGEGKLFEGYGSTEAAGISSLRPEDQLLKRQCVGRILTGVEAKIVDEAGAALPPGEVGELVVRTPQMFQGYWNRPDATAEALRDGWYHTGDLGQFDAEGYLFIVDRKKNMIISGGQNIYPREIEEILYQHPSVAEAAVIGVKDDYWGEAVVAYCVPAPGASIDAAALKDHCARNLARYKIPKAFHQIASMPKNGTGKIMHRSLREMTPG